MKKEDKFKSVIRLKDAEEFLASARANIDAGRFKASLDHAIDSVIAANDAFTIHFIEEIPSYDHHEAIKLHKLAGQKISENRVNDIADLLEERHRKTYRTVSVTKSLAELTLKKATGFVEWVTSNVKK